MSDKLKAANAADVLAADIRRIDGDHSLGAGELAEKLIAIGWLPSPDNSLTAAIRPLICNCAGAVGQANGFLQGVSTCELLLPHQRGAAKQFAKELESRWDALSAELEQLLSRQSDWRPIATAPKDEAVLTYGFGYEVAHFSTRLGQWVACWNHRPIKPTHWMPLPASPVAQEGRDSE